MMYQFKKDKKFCDYETLFEVKFFYNQNYKSQKRERK